MLLAQGDVNNTLYLLLNGGYGWTGTTDPSIMRSLPGLYSVVLVVNKQGIRCLDDTTLHNRAGPCPVKVPNSVPADSRTGRS